MADNDKDDDQPKLKLVFAPGCFDDFDGTQEELDTLIAEITKEMTQAWENGELDDDDDVLEEEDAAKVLTALEHFTSTNTRH